MIGMTIKITGTRKVQDRLKRLGSSLYEFKGAMGEIGSEGAKYYSNQGFASQGGVFGGRWAALSPRYAAVKSKLYPGRPPLVQSGKMQNSFTFVASSKEVLIGNKAPYFKYHQSTLPRNKMPRRQTMGINDPIRKMVRSIIESDVKKKMRTA